jgi:hypothetical protein
VPVEVAVEVRGERRDRADLVAAAQVVRAGQQRVEPLILAAAAAAAVTAAVLGLPVLEVPVL